MKAVILLAIVAAVSAQTIDVTWGSSGRIGYDNIAKDVDKNKGYLHGGFPIAWPAGANATRDHVYLRVLYETTSATSTGSTFTLIGSDQTMTPKAIADGQTVLSKAAGNDHGEGYMEVFPNATTVWVGAEITCSTCSKSADFKFSAYIEYGPTPATAVRVPYPIVDNSFTWDFSLPVNTYGVAGKVTLPAAGSTTLFAAVDVQGTGTASITLVYNQGAPYAAAGSTGTLPAAQTATTKVVPFPTSRNGDYRTGGLSTLTAGDWYISPFVNNPGTVGANAPFDIAFGFGHEPSAAGMVFPSVILAAILALFALLF
jgi:hypothetical protein